MNLREAAQQALEALETEPESYADWLRTMRAARTALRAALSEDRVADTGKTYDDTDDTPEQRMLRKKWFGGRLYGHLPFLEAVDETMKSLYDKLDEANGTWKMLDNHFPDVSKMVATIRPEVTVEPVATINEMETVEPVAWMRPDCGHVDFHRHPDYLPLYSAPPKREPMTEQQLDEMFDQAEIAIYIADRQQKEHLEVYSFGVRDAEKWHGIGGEE